MSNKMFYYLQMYLNTFRMLNIWIRSIVVLQNSRFSLGCHVKCVDHSASHAAIYGCVLYDQKRN
ncbi:unnamed protein product [Ixodes hexagonus]